MPTTIRRLFAAAGLKPDGCVQWGTPVPAPTDAPRTGIYAVATTKWAASLVDAPPKAALQRDAVEELLAARPELTIDGERPDMRALARRLAALWVPGEVVLYVGLAGSDLSRRVGQYYVTPPGARSPHAGGWPLKMLATLNDLHVHYAYCTDCREAERVMLEAFAAGVRANVRAGLHDPERVMPFANLEYPQGVRKRHGIGGAKAPRKKSASARASRGGRPPGSSPQPGATSRGGTADAGDVTTHRHTQTITGGDIKAGIIRIPGATKAVFPNRKARIEIDLRGERTECGWDPREGPDRSRSGVLRVGRDLTGLIEQGKRLAVARDSGGAYHL